MYNKKYKFLYIEYLSRYLMIQNSVKIYFNYLQIYFISNILIILSNFHLSY